MPGFMGALTPATGLGPSYISQQLWSRGRCAIIAASATCHIRRENGSRRRGCAWVDVRHSFRFLGMLVPELALRPLILESHRDEFSLDACASRPEMVRMA